MEGYPGRYLQHVLEAGDRPLPQDLESETFVEHAGPRQVVNAHGDGLEGADVAGELPAAQFRASLVAVDVQMDSVGIGTDRVPDLDLLGDRPVLGLVGTGGARLHQTREQLPDVVHAIVQCPEAVPGELVCLAPYPLTGSIELHQPQHPGTFHSGGEQSHLPTNA